jgi:hypothetical protein
MAITAASKMRATIECDISYSGQHIQTIQFDHLNETTTRTNWQAAADLISTAQNIGCRADLDDRVLFTGVPRNLIVQFLRKFHVETSRNDLKTEFLRGYINGDDAGLEEWNVGVITSGILRPSDKELGSLGQVSTVVRSRLIQDADGPANIKALMSRRDIMIDCPDIEFDGNAKWNTLKEKRRAHLGNRPLLLLYPIERTSRPKPDTKSREPLDACGDQIGIGIVFPGSTTGSGGYFHVDLNPPATEDLDAMDAEVSEMEALGLVA